MLKIVHIFWGLSFGGIETMLVNIANGQVSEDTEISLVLINNTYDSSLLNALNPAIRVYKLNRVPHSANLWFIAKLNHLLSKINPDVVHIHGSNILQAILLPSLRKKVCSTLHSLPHGQLRGLDFKSRLCPFFNIFIDGNVSNIDRVPTVYAISQSVRDELKHKYHIESKVINNGIKTECFDVKKNYDLCNRPVRIVQIGRLIHDVKGQDLTLLALSEIRDKAFTLDFIGEGPSREHLTKMVKKLGLESKVNFLGKLPQDYLYSRLHEYDLLIQPSRSEGFGLTISEAMASGVPVIVSGGQGAEEVTRGNEYGWVFRNGDYGDLKDLISMLISNYKLAEAKAQKAKEFVDANFNVSVTSRKYLDEYRRLVGKH